MSNKTTKTVVVSDQGVQFGNAWFSHESITGYSAEQLNAGTCGATGGAYMTWLSADEPDAALAREAALREELERVKSRYDREVLGLNNEGDPIGGDPAGGYKNDNARLQQRLTVVEQRASMLEREFKKLRDVAHGCYEIASSYSGCIDGVEEHGGDDHEDPSCAIFHRLYYAMFDADRALKPAADAKSSPLCPNCKVCMGSPDFPENCLINGNKP